MPQLNPSPWFVILVFAWLVFAIIIPVKVLAYNFPNDPLPPIIEKPLTEPWAWPWQ